MTVTVTPEAEPVPAAWREKPPFANLMKPGDSGRLVANGEERYLHCLSAGRYVITLRNERPAGVPEEPLAALYAALWARLFGARDASPSEQARVLAEVERDLPRQCGCLHAWTSWKREHPPVYGDGFFAWLVEAKNEIRRRQGKSTMTVEEVWALYATG